MHSIDALKIILLTFRAMQELDRLKEKSPEPHSDSNNAQANGRTLLAPVKHAVRRFLLVLTNFSGSAYYVIILLEQLSRAGV